MKKFNIDVSKLHLFRTLLFSGFGLSAIFCLLFALVELEYIDESISDQAVREGQSLYRFIQKDGSNKNGTLDQKVHSYLLWQKKLGLDFFIFVELYSVDGKEIGKAKLTDVDHVIPQISNHVKEFPTEHGKWYRKVSKNWHLYLQTITPIYDDMNLHVGYFEGVYRISDKNLKAIVIRLLIGVAGLAIAIVSAVLLLFPIITRQQQHITQQNKTLLLSNLQILRVLGNAIAKRDNDTHEHNYRVTLYAVMLANAAKVDFKQVRGIIKGAFLHDVGKIAITDNILLKPGKLTEEEFEVMKTHVIHGKDIVGDSEWLVDARDIVYCHHEKFGGGGYPKGLVGEEIPIAARIFAIVDVFDALTSKRPYKEPFSLEKSFAILEEGKANHFDPKLLELFMLSAEEWQEKIVQCDSTQLNILLSEVILRYFGVEEPS